MRDVTSQPTDRHVETIARWLLESGHVVAFTGAGISTDSGIPDFRGPDGVWTRRDAGLPPPRWRVNPAQVRPNPSHLALAEWHRLGRLAFLITQNTDGLHRESGIEPGRLAELHGNGRLMRCLGCGRQFPRAAVGWDRARWGPGYRTDRPKRGQPACPHCGGRLVSSVVNFGDPLPADDLPAPQDPAGGGARPGLRPDAGPGLAAGGQPGGGAGRRGGRG